MFKKNELVLLKNDQSEILYTIVEIDQDIAVIKGYSHRIIKKESVDNLIIATELDVEKEEKKVKKFHDRLIKNKSIRSKNPVLFGTVLHIDGDEKFLNSCLDLYKELNIHAWGLHIDEKNIKQIINKAIEDVTPNIVVITGHDFYNGKEEKNLDNYENSKEFIEAVHNIRKQFTTEDIIVIAGACSSHFEALIANGANFASSPKRINIHTYDPAVIAIKCATTSCNQNINFQDILKYIENGRDAYGGIETKGKMKLLL